jgi:hypothetical protein
VPHIVYKDKVRAKNNEGVLSTIGRKIRENVMVEVIESLLGVK